METLTKISTQTCNSEVENKLEGENIFSSSYDITNLINKDELAKKIFDNLQLVLSEEFSSVIKRTPVPHKDRISFSCVYCGDSHKDERKKRGNVFYDTMQYHCFNGDCKAHMSLYDFFKDKKRLDNFTLSEQTYMREASYAKSMSLKNLKSSLGLESFLSPEIMELSVDREDIMKIMKLKEISGSRIEKYLLNRLQKDFNKFGWDQKNGLLYVFNLTPDNKVIGLQIKTFNKRNPYLTWKLSRMHEELGILKEENIEKLQKFDLLSSIFGIFLVDINKSITVFEGPLDSFLFPNSIALCSAKNSMPFEIEDTRYFYDRDLTGIDYSLKRLTEGKEVFLWGKYIKDNNLQEEKIKDLNELLIFMKRNSNKKFTRFADYFSNNKYDIHFI